MHTVCVCVCASRHVCVRTMTINDEKEKLKNALNQINEKNVEKKKNNTCALLFFGLPRCFVEQALPSIKTYIIDYNPTCDVYLHTYDIQTLPANTRNKEIDTPINITNVYLLTNNVIMDTMEEFSKKRNVKKYTQS